MLVTKIIHKIEENCAYCEEKAEFLAYQMSVLMTVKYNFICERHKRDYNNGLLKL